ncbi:MAG TPA: isoprenylcysteine carboxylmethyltransferase family protein [Desulfatiglandales bacterium]|nr:isoprenylcysteine carboxylmethyltransferase family protein [Desulfatiglandales bacterium]
MGIIKRAQIEKLRKPATWFGGAIFIIVLVFSAPPDNTTLVSKVTEIIGYVFITLAMLGRVWCAVYIDGSKNSELVKDGPYSIWRNPLYIFSFLGLIGILLGIQALSLLLIVTPVYWGFYFFVIKTEEKRLLELFGEEFVNYRSKVNRIIPRFWNYWSRSDIANVNSRLLFRSIIRASFFMWFLLLLEIFNEVKLIQANGKGIIPILWSMPF